MIGENRWNVLCDKRGIKDGKIAVRNCKKLCQAVMFSKLRSPDGYLESSRELYKEICEPMRGR